MDLNEVSRQNKESASLLSLFSPKSPRRNDDAIDSKNLPGGGLIEIWRSDDNAKEGRWTALHLMSVLERPDTYPSAIPFIPGVRCVVQYSSVQRSALWQILRKEDSLEEWLLKNIDPSLQELVGNKDDLRGAIQAIAAVLSKDIVSQAKAAFDKDEFKVLLDELWEMAWSATRESNWQIIDEREIFPGKYVKFGKGNHHRVLSKRLLGPLSDVILIDHLR